MSRGGDELRIVSHLPGRVRVRADAFRDPAIAAEVERAVAAEPGVIAAVASAITGGLLVTYDPAKIQLDRVLDRVLTAAEITEIAANAAPEGRAPGERKAVPGARVRGAFRRLDARCREAMQGRLDVRTAVPAVCLAAGLGRFALGNRVIPKWYELAFWSFVTFVNFNPRDAEARAHGR